MATEAAVPDSSLESIHNIVSAGFWTHADFWISTIIGLAALYYSVMAFSEAKKAKQAANEAGKTVKIQTVTIELTEISQKLDKLRPEILFSEARDLLTETSRRLRRAVSAFRGDTEFAPTIDGLLAALDAAKASLNTVRPASAAAEGEAPQAVYFAIEGDMAAINNLVADLTGLFERRNIVLGEDHARR